MKVEIEQCLIDVEISAFKLADIFWNMDAEEQATFFAMIGKNKVFDLAMQLEAVSQSGNMNLDGRNFMRQIGDYSWHNA